MIMRLVGCILLLFCSVCNLLAEKFVGKVLSEEDKTPVVYAHILHGGTTFGVFTDENGTFEFESDICEPMDTIQFTCVGYETISVCFQSLQKNTVVYMKQEVFQLDDVSILGGNYKIKTKKGLGMRIPGGAGELNNVIDSLRGFSELGTVFNLKKPFQIENVLFQVTKAGHSDSYFRLNVYTLMNDSVFEIKNTMNEIVKIEKGRNNVLYKFPIHVSEPLTGKVYISFELVKFSDLGESDKIVIPAYLGASFVKVYNSQKFVSHPISLGLKIEGKELQR